jgi:hypothetical protein
MAPRFVAEYILRAKRQRPVGAGRDASDSPHVSKLINLARSIPKAERMTRRFGHTCESSARTAPHATFGRIVRWEVSE